MMNTMKTLLLAGAMLAGGLLHAQDKSGQPAGQKDPEARIAKMTERLELTEAQVVRMREIHAAHDKRMEQVRQIEDEAKRKEAFRDLRTSRKNAVKAVLTPEQQARMAEWKAERKSSKEGQQKREGMRHGQGGEQKKP